MVKKIIAFIESNTTGTGYLFLKKAIELDFNVLFFASDPNKYSFLSELSIEVIQINTLDKDYLLKYLKTFSDLSGVFSTSEYFIEITAFIAKSLNLPGNDVEAVIRCRNKKIFYENLKSTSFNIPQTWFIENLEQINEKRKEFIFPVIIKPILGTGSIGVKKCSNFSDLYEDSSKLLSMGNAIPNTESEKGIIIQRYIEGPEYSAEIIGVGENYFPIGITAKHTTDNLYFIETGHDFPAVLEKNVENYIWDSIKRALKFLNFRFGPAHIEFKLVNSEMILIEINPRLAGGMIPQLIYHACHIDLYDIILKIYLKEEVKIPLLKYEGSSIRFFVANKNGTITDLVDKKVLMKCKDVVEVHYNKKIKDFIAINNDYRDRVGCLITKASNSENSKKSADEAMRSFFMKVSNDDKTIPSGRLSQEPHSLIKEILRKPVDKEKLISELKKIVTIDLAHLLMLFKNNMISSDQIIPLIHEIKQFQENLLCCWNTLDFSRGTYYAYENYLKKKLGIELSGNNHIARSRNDINATLFYLLSRNSFQKIYRKVLIFSKCLVSIADTSSHITLPIYSQHQPALPGNYAFYLLAVNEPIRRVIEDLQYLEKYLNICPLGSCAGAGSNMPIQPIYTSHLLGFEASFTNALDAIANRDFALRYRGILATLCITLSRIAQDYQLWTTQEFHFFELPDSLCSSSSMMPQKKNPYILEVIKSKTIDVISDLFGVFSKMHKVPTGNSIEVSSAAYDTIDFITTECLCVLDLLMLVVTYANAIPKNILNANKKGLTIATSVANQVMKNESITFRQAHLKTGEMIRNVEGNEDDVFRQLLSYMDSENMISESESINKIIKDLEYGRGPGPSSISSQMSKALNDLKKSDEWIAKKEYQWEQAQLTLDNEINKILLIQETANNH